MKRIKYVLILYTTIGAAIFLGMIVGREASWNNIRFVLLYATCTVNKDYLSPYVSAIRYTPNLKTFANESIVFTRHQTESPFSGGAYASLFSGTSVYRHGIYYHPARLSDKSYLLGEAFRDNGYETFFWNVQYLASDKLNYAQGIPSKNIFHSRPGDGRTLTFNDKNFRSILTHLVSDPSYKAFVQVNFSITHAPYSGNSNLEMTSSFCRNFPEECKDITDDDLAHYIPIYAANHIGLQYRFEQTIQSLKLDPQQVMKLVKVVEAMYKSSISRLDQAFGETVEALRQTGLLDQTLIVFTSDHGEILYRKDAPVKWFHGCLEPEVLNIPLLIRMPGAQNSGTYFKKLTRAMDIFRTLATVCGLKIPKKEHPDGQDLSSAAFGKKTLPDLTSYALPELTHPAVIGKLDNPSRLPVLARVQDNVYKLFPDSRIEFFQLKEDGLIVNKPFDSRNQTDVKIVKLLKDYRNRVIQGYRGLVVDQSDWSEIRERLHSLGYLK